MISEAKLKMANKNFLQILNKKKPKKKNIYLSETTKNVTA